MKPPYEATIERSRNLMDEGLWTLSLQQRRLKSSEPEDKKFVFRWWADLQFFIVTLRRFRRAAEIAIHIPMIEKEVEAEIVKFDSNIPMLKVMRNVGEHIDDYALDGKGRRHKEVERYHLQVGSFDGVTYNWLGQNLNIDVAYDAAVNLFKSMIKIFTALETRQKISIEHN